ASADPLHWYRGMLTSVWSRAVVVGLHNIDVIARDAGTSLVHPLRDRSFLAALAPVAGRWGFPDRASLMVSLFSDDLPGHVLTRTSKARFNGAFFGAYAREFIDSWDGTGIDTTLVDPEALRRQWQAPEVHGM